MKRIAIIQSAHIPWKGYFDIINSVDEFVLYDDAQYTRRDWRNRNLIKTALGLKWLTIPVRVSGRFTQKISETEISDPRWAESHWRQLASHYAAAPYFALYRDGLEALYRERRETHLSAINHRFLTALCALLGIRTPLRWSSDYVLTGSPSEKLVSICRQAGAQVYLSGPAAKDYLDEELFTQAGIRVEWMDYSSYPPYRQLHGLFEHGVSLLDLLLKEGPATSTLMKSFAAAPLS